MDHRALTIAIPVLLLAYGVARLSDGADGYYGPGTAWNIGHLAFLAPFAGFGALTIHFWRVGSPYGRILAITAGASLVGVGQREITGPLPPAPTPHGRREPMRSGKQRDPQPRRSRSTGGASSKRFPL